MQLFLDNWTAELVAPAGAAATEVHIAPELAATLGAIDPGDYHEATLARILGFREVAWEVVRITGVAAGVLTVERGPAPLELDEGDTISLRVTAGWLASVTSTLHLYAGLLGELTNDIAHRAPLLQTQVIDAPALTLGLEHLNCLLEFSGPCVVTVPAQASVAWPATARVLLCQASAGDVEVLAGEAVALARPASRQRLLLEPGAVATLLRRPAVNSWRLFGDLRAAGELVGALLTEAGDPLLTEAGEPLQIEE